MAHIDLSRSSDAASGLLHRDRRAASYWTKFEPASPLGRRAEGGFLRQPEHEGSRHWMSPRRNIEKDGEIHGHKIPPPVYLAGRASRDSRWREQGHCTDQPPDSTLGTSLNLPSMTTSGKSSTTSERIPIERSPLAHQSFGPRPHEEPSPCTTTTGPRSPRRHATNDGQDKQGVQGFDEWMAAQRAPAPVMSEHGRTSIERTFDEEWRRSQPTLFTSGQPSSTRQHHSDLWPQGDWQGERRGVAELALEPEYSSSADQMDPMNAQRNSPRRGRHVTDVTRLAPAVRESVADTLVHGAAPTPRPLPEYTSEAPLGFGRSDLHNQHNSRLERVSFAERAKQAQSGADSYAFRHVSNDVTNWQQPHRGDEPQPDFSRSASDIHSQAVDRAYRYLCQHGQGP